MARPPSDQPTDGELEILKVLWDQGPTQLGAICKALRQQRPVATTTVATILKLMLSKGLVTRKQGPRSYLWSAKVNQKTTVKKMLRKLRDRVFDGSAKHMVAHLIEDGRLSPQDRQEILNMLSKGSERGNK